MDELLRKPAREVVRLLGCREVGPVELVRLALERIAAVDPLVNAVPTVCAERALAQARAISSLSRAGASTRRPSSSSPRSPRCCPLSVRHSMRCARARFR